MKPFTIWTRSIQVVRDLFPSNGEAHFYIISPDNTLRVVMTIRCGSKNEWWRKQGVWIAFNLYRQYIVK